MAGMERVYSAWRNSEGSQLTFWRGEEPPLTGNGKPLEGCDVLLWRVEAASWEEAQAIKHIRLGYGPNVPVGDPAPCPAGGAMYYPGGRAECWNCEHLG